MLNKKEKLHILAKYIIDVGFSIHHPSDFDKFAIEGDIFHRCHR